MKMEVPLWPLGGGCAIVREGSRAQGYPAMAVVSSSATAARPQSVRRARARELRHGCGGCSALLPAARPTRIPGRSLSPARAGRRVPRRRAGRRAGRASADYRRAPVLMVAAAIGVESRDAQYRRSRCGRAATSMRTSARRCGASLRDRYLLDGAQPRSMPRRACAGKSTSRYMGTCMSAVPP